MCLIVEDEPYMAEAIRDGLRLEAIAADIAGDGDTALELLSINAYDIAVLDRDIPGPSGDEIAEHIVSLRAAACRSSCSPRPTGSTTRPPGSSSAPTTTSRSPSSSESSCSVSERSTAGAPTTGHPCARSQVCVWIRSAARSTATAATSRSTRKQFAVLEVLVAAEGGVVSAEELLERAWDENADPFTNAVRITVSALRKRLGEPWIIATVAGVGYRIDTEPDTGHEGGDRG